MTRPDYKSRGRSARPDPEPEVEPDAAAPPADPLLDKQINHVIEQAIDGKVPTLDDLAREVAQPEQNAPRPMAEVWWRGNLITIHTDEPPTAVFFALLALEDPRVDAVLSRLPFKLLDAHGNVVWPVNPVEPS